MVMSACFMLSDRQLDGFCLNVSGIWDLILEIRIFHGGEYVDCGLLGSDVV
jgi:hypothetical protein